MTQEDAKMGDPPRTEPDVIVVVVEYMLEEPKADVPADLECGPWMDAIILRPNGLGSLA